MKYNYKNFKFSTADFVMFDVVNLFRCVIVYTIRKSMLPDVDVNAVTRDDDPYNHGPNTCSREIFGRPPNYTFYYIHVNAIDVPPNEKLLDTTYLARISISLKNYELCNDI